MNLIIMICLAVSGANCKQIEYPMDTVTIGHIDNPIVIVMTREQCLSMAPSVLGEIMKSYPKYKIDNWTCK